MLDRNRIRDLQYQIRRVELDIKNLERTIETKRKNKFLDSDTDLALKQQIVLKQGVITTLQAEIRKMENSAQRAQNFEEGFGV